MKLIRLLTIIGFLVGILSFIVIIRAQNRQLTYLDRKAKTYDEMCSSIRVHLRTQIRGLRGSNDVVRQFVLREYDEQIADRTRMFEWCTLGPEADRPVVEAYLQALAACHRDIPCVVGVLEEVEEKIDARP